MSVGTRRPVDGRGRVFPLTGLPVPYPAVTKRYFINLVSCGYIAVRRISGDTYGAVSVEQYIDRVVSYLCDLLRTALLQLTRAKFRQIEQRNASRGPVALLISDWMCALAAWVPPIGHETFPLLGGLARFWDPFAREIMEGDRVAKHMQGHLITAMEQYVSLPPDAEKWDFFQLPIVACRIFALDLVNVDLELELRHPKFEEEYVDVAVPLIPLFAERGSSMDNAREWLSGLLHARNAVPVPGMMPRRPSPDVAFNNDYFNARYQMFLARQSQQCIP
ncbi:hypothetical protein C8J57DRAFT_1233581 [Mycena rebaudengoi]|nr:hypothetical protein C8J57DRAFT_1233581 [Mycena rebaudengoi]